MIHPFARSGTKISSLFSMCPFHSSDFLRSTMICLSLVLYSSLRSVLVHWDRGRSS